MPIYLLGNQRGEAHRGGGGSSLFFSLYSSGVPCAGVQG